MPTWGSNMYGCSCIQISWHPSLCSARAIIASLFPPTEAKWILVQIIIEWTCDQSFELNWTASGYSIGCSMNTARRKPAAILCHNTAFAPTRWSMTRTSTDNQTNFGCSKDWRLTFLFALREIYVDFKHICMPFKCHNHSTMTPATIIANHGSNMIGTPGKCGFRF
jgi:hypothetical protein